MQIILRRLRTVKTIQSHKDELVSGDILTIGRGADQTIFLPNPRVALRHATLVENDSGTYSLQGVGNNKFKLNGKTTDQSLVKFDDLIELGGFEIRFKLSDEKDLMLELSEKFTDQTEGLKQSLIDGSSDHIRFVLPKKRLLGWTLAITILLSGFLIPAVQITEKETESEFFHHTHSESRSFFSRQCTGCHSRKFTDSNLQPVSSFARHPQFRVPVEILDNNEYRYISIDQYAGQTNLSHVTFPHKLHLAKKLDQPGGHSVELECSSCHSWNSEGEIKRVNFDDNCGDCHRPTIPNSDGVPLPHGDLEGLVSLVKRYYSTLSVDSSVQEVKEVTTRLIRPGQKTIRPRPQKSTLPPSQLSDSAIKEIVYYTGCNTCHEIVVGGGGESGIPMKVKGIDKIRWYGKATFNHEKHSKNCSNCHAAESSESSADILLPEITTCQTCHTGHVLFPSNAATNCVTCHQFSVEITTAENEK